MREGESAPTVAAAATDALPTRRSLREARDGHRRPVAAPRPQTRAPRAAAAVPAASTPDVRPVRDAAASPAAAGPRPAAGRPAATRPAATRSGAAQPIGRRRRTVSKVVASLGVLSFAGAIVATLALPSYAFTSGAVAQMGSASVSHTLAGHQRLRVSGDVTVADVHRDSFSATSAAELKRQQYAAQYASYTGPSASDYIKNPAHPAFSLDAVLAVAEKYQGVPYVFGGADPSGFDCSGFVMFVYAQFGISLPHSVHQQDEIGAHISPADAQPGDIVVFDDDSHDGFYMGDGVILHAPYPGASVRIQPLWSSDVHYIRFGIGD